MNGGFDAGPILDGLKGFQRRTVEHVDRRFHEDDPPARRFLVADETGLGKSMVARGVIARTIERLQHDQTVGRIDVLYVCSNAAIAAQNLKRLDVLDAGGVHHSTRLTLLARDSNELEGVPDPKAGVGKKVNLISFTPGTSFDLGYSTGRAEERALLHVILTSEFGRKRKVERRSSLVLHGSAGIEGFRRRVDGLWAWSKSQEKADKVFPDPAITERFLGSIRASGLLGRYADAVEEVGQRQILPADVEHKNARLVGELRSALRSRRCRRSRTGPRDPRRVPALPPPARHGRSRLSRGRRATAHLLFDYGHAKVLLLSATPYKPFTLAEEAAAGDDHESDLRRTLGFLAATTAVGRRSRRSSTAWRTSATQRSGDQCHGPQARPRGAADVDHVPDRTAPARRRRHADRGG